MICCAEAFALWTSTCPTFTVDPVGGLIRHQKGVSRHIPQPEMPILEPAKSLAEAIPAPITAAQPKKIVEDMKMDTLDKNFGKTNDNIDSILRYLRDARVQTDTAYDELGKRVNEISESNDVHFSLDGLASSLAGVALDDGRGGRGYLQTKQGTMIILTIRGSADVLTGTVTAAVKKNGVLNGFEVSLDPTDNPTFASNRVDPGTYNYDAADIISVVVTTSAGLTPSVDIDVSLGLVHG